jgi:hypothetical protein
MSFLDDVGLPLGDVVGGFTGKAGADAALEGAQSQTRIGREGLQLNAETLRRLEETLAPFLQSGQNRIGQASELFGPQGFQSISQDPSFLAGANRVKQNTLAQQAARGRTGAGETPFALSGQLSNFGQDFQSRQRGDLLSSLQLGQASAAQQAAGGLQSGQRASDLLTQIGNSQAAGGIGAAQSLGQGAQNTGSLISTIFSAFSDRRLKRNITQHGKWRGHNTYKYQYKNSDDWFIGVMSDEVKAVNPGAVRVHENGYDVVNYGAL